MSEAQDTETRTVVRCSAAVESLDSLGPSRAMVRESRMDAYQEATLFYRTGGSCSLRRCPSLLWPKALLAFCRLKDPENKTLIASPRLHPATIRLASLVPSLYCSEGSVSPEFNSLPAQKMHQAQDSRRTSQCHNRFSKYPINYAFLLPRFPVNLSIYNKPQ